MTSPQEHEDGVDLGLGEGMNDAVARYKEGLYAYTVSCRKSEKIITEGADRSVWFLSPFFLTDLVND